MGGADRVRAAGPGSATMAFPLWRMVSRCHSGTRDWNRSGGRVPSGQLRGRSSAGRALDWQSRGSWVRVPSPPLEIAGQGHFVPGPSAGGLAHSRAIHARDPLDIDLFRRVRNRPAARVPYPVGTCESVQQAGGQRPRHQPPDGDRRGRGGCRCRDTWPGRGRATPPPIRALPAGPSGSMLYAAARTAFGLRRPGPPSMVLEVPQLVGHRKLPTSIGVAVGGPTADGGRPLVGCRAAAIGSMAQTPGAEAHQCPNSAIARRSVLKRLWPQPIVATPN